MVLSCPEGSSGVLRGPMVGLRGPKGFSVIFGIIKNHNPRILCQIKVLLEASSLRFQVDQYQFMIT